MLEINGTYLSYTLLGPQKVVPVPFHYPAFAPKQALKAAAWMGKCQEWHLHQKTRAHQKITKDLSSSKCIYLGQDIKKYWYINLLVGAYMRCLVFKKCWARSSSPWIWWELVAVQHIRKSRPQLGAYSWTQETCICTHFYKTVGHIFLRCWKVIA